MVLPHEEPLQGYHREIGGSAGSGTHGGTDVQIPDGMPSRSDADYHVTNYDELRDALDEEGSVVYVADDIDVTGEGPIQCAGGNILVGQYCDPSVSGSGHQIHYDDLPEGGETAVIMQKSGTPLKMYGVYLQGPIEEFTDEDYDDPEFEETLRAGVWIRTPYDAGLFEAVGCRFSGWTWSGVQLGDYNNRTDAEIRRCTFDMCNYNHYGYGCCSYDTDLFIDRCFFDDCRHATAAYGHPTETHDIKDSIMGPGPGASHAWDLHGLRNNSDTDELTAGGHLRMLNCTTMQVETIWGDDQEGVRIRGIPEELSWFRNCHFYHSAPPSDDPDENQAIRVEEADTWYVDEEDEDTVYTNVHVFDGQEDAGNNHYSESNPPDGVGAPLAEQDNDDSNSKNTTMEPPYQRLTIHGKSDRCDYKLEISGKAEEVKDEGSDNVSSIDGGTEIVGYVYGNYADEFHIANDAVIEKAKFDGACSVAIDGQTVQLGPAISSGLSDNDF